MYIDISIAKWDNIILEHLFKLYSTGKHGASRSQLIESYNRNIYKLKRHNQKDIFR